MLAPPRSRRRRLAAALLPTLILTAAVAAQAPEEGAPEGLRIRIVGAADRVPRPGVLLFAGSFEPPRAEANGFVLADSPELRRLRVAGPGYRTDPAGEALLPALPARNPGRWFAGEPFVLLGRGPVVDAVPLWRVAEHEPVGVRAVDPSGRPLARFPVALHAGGRDVSVAITDAAGRALLGVPPGHLARLQLCPAGWVGPRDGMPTIASMLPGRRGAELVVPPHGSLVVRAVRRGAVATTRLGAVTIHSADRSELLASWAPHGDVDATGVEFARTALGFPVVVRTWLSDEHATRGPDRAGGTRTVDASAPWRPELTFRTAGVPQSLLAGIEVRLHSDTAQSEATAIGMTTGAWLVKRTALHGERLRRVDLDVIGSAADRGELVGWTASVAVDVDLAQPRIDLGEVAFVRVPRLHGLVVHPDGRPVADAEVHAVSEPADRGWVLRTDAAGRFLCTMPPHRAADGTLRPWRARAVAEGRGSATFPAPADGSALVLQLQPLAAVAPVPAAALDPSPTTGPDGARARGAGSLELVAVDSGGLATDRSRWFLAAATGFTAAPTALVRADDGSVRVRFDRLQGGRHTLLFHDEDGRRLVMNGLDVPAAGACRDPRLDRVSLLDDLRTVRLRVVDREGVPIAGATVSSPGLQLVTDGRGEVDLATQEAGPIPVMVAANGCRPRELAALRSGSLVLEPAGVLRVQLRAMPADIPRERVEVWLRHEDRARFHGPRGQPDADGRLELPTPTAGRYLVWLLVRTAAEPTRDRTSAAAIRPEPVVVDGAELAPIEWQIDDAIVQRVRELLVDPTHRQHR